MFVIYTKRCAFVVGWMAWLAMMSAIVVEWFSQGFDDYPLIIVGIMVFLLYLALGFFCVSLTVEHWPRMPGRSIPPRERR